MFADHWLFSWQMIDFSPINSNPNWHSNLKTSRLENPSPSLIPYNGVPGSPQLSFSISVEINKELIYRRIKQTHCMRILIHRKFKANWNNLCKNSCQDAPLNLILYPSFLGRKFCMRNPTRGNEWVVVLELIVVYS